MISTATICLIACHGGAADHFATYAQALTQKGYDVQIHATGPALTKLQERGIEVKSSFVLDKLSSEEEDLLAQQIAKTCSVASLILTDVGHPFDIKIHQALRVHATHVPCAAYYDNFENWVPGGYSTTFAAVMEFAQKVLFANEHLAQSPIFSAIGQKIDLSHTERFSVGYYAVSKAKEIAAQRKAEHDTAHAAFLKEHKIKVPEAIKAPKAKIWVYFGGNNEEYFEQAFPAFLSLLSQTSQLINLKNHVIILQQHPGALQTNRDLQKIEAWKKDLGERTDIPRLIVSHFSSDHAQVLADAAFYYQTTMGPQFVLAGIPTVQIGHKPYEDVLVRNKLIPSVTQAERFVQVVPTLEILDEMSEQNVLNGVGFREDWPETLEDAIKRMIGQPV